MAEFQIRTVSGSDVAVVAVTGELEAITVPQLRATVAPLLQGSRAGVVVDLSDVTLLDCAAIGSLMQMQGIADQGGGALQAVGATGRVLDVLEITGVAKRLGVHQSLDEAIASCGDPELIRRTSSIRSIKPAEHPNGWIPDQAIDVMLIELQSLAPAAPARARLRQQVIELALPLAGQLARRYANRGQSADDLLQVASLGLVKAVDGYDPDLGHRFIAYAVPTIVGELRRYFRDKTWGVRAPRRLQELRMDLVKAAETLTAVLDRSPTIAELAEYLDASEEEIIEAETAARGYRPTSLSQPLGDQPEAGELVDVLGADDADLELVDLHVSLPPLLAALPARERRIIALRFFGNLTQAEIARQVGISQMHVSRLLTRSLATLRTALMEDGAAVAAPSSILP
jgi:RNA polymerase sigma-B factor